MRVINILLPINVHIMLEYLRYSMSAVPNSENCSDQIKQSKSMK